MTEDLSGYVAIAAADVYKNGHLAAQLTRGDNGQVRFAYVPEYEESGLPPVATTLPFGATRDPLPGGALPAFFTGVLPEGRRFSALRRAVRTSPDDELSLLLAVGTDLVGDVAVVPHGEPSPFAQVHGVWVTQGAGPLGDASAVDFGALRAEHGILDRAGLPGIQDKASRRTIALPVTLGGDRPYLVKLDPPEYPALVRNEEALLVHARRLRGLRVATARVIEDRHGEPGLWVERFDRVPSRAWTFAHRAVEDGTQVLDLPPAAKYRVSGEEVSLALAARCAAAPVARRALFLQFVWAWLSGNGDLHAKNLAILGDGDGEWRVAPTYDIPSTLPYGDVHGMALPIGGRTDALSRRRFLAFADDIGLPRTVAERAIGDALRVAGGLVEHVEAGLFPLPPGATAKRLARQLRARRKAIE